MDETERKSGSDDNGKRHSVLTRRRADNGGDK